MYKNSKVHFADYEYERAQEPSQAKPSHCILFDVCIIQQLESNWNKHTALYTHRQDRHTIQRIALSCRKNKIRASTRFSKFQTCDTHTNTETTHTHTYGNRHHACIILVLVVLYAKTFFFNASGALFLTENTSIDCINCDFITDFQTQTGWFQFIMLDRFLRVVLVIYYICLLQLQTIPSLHK